MTRIYEDDDERKQRIERENEELQQRHDAFVEKAMGRSFSKDQAEFLWDIINTIYIALG